MCRHLTTQVFKRKKGRKTETGPIKWNQAKTLITCEMEDGKYNTALMIAAGIYFGLRIGGILKLTWSQILSESFAITEGKTKKSRKIFNDSCFLFK